jgi:phage baseplate assembly protein W
MSTINTPSRIYKDIDLSFAMHPTSRDILKKIDVNAVKQSLKTLILTGFNERPFQPDLGSPIYRLLFEPVDPITTEVLRRAIEQVIQNHEPRVYLNLVEVVPNEDSNEYNITIYFTVVGIPTPVTFGITLQRLR